MYVCMMEKHLFFFKRPGRRRPRAPGVDAKTLDRFFYVRDRMCMR